MIVLRGFFSDFTQKSWLHFIETAQSSEKIISEWSLSVIFCVLAFASWPEYGGHEALDISTEFSMLLIHIWLADSFDSQKIISRPEV
jgi:hypothetical protein